MDAKVGIEQWRQHYNEVRPHSSLGYLTPAEFTAQLRAGSDDGGRVPAMPACQISSSHVLPDPNPRRSARVETGAQDSRGIFRCFRHQLLLPRPYLVLTKSA